MLGVIFTSIAKSRSVGADISNKSSSFVTAVHDAICSPAKFALEGQVTTKI